MNSPKTTVTPISASLMLSLSFLSGFVIVELVQAQANRANYQLSDIPIDDQARYLRGLKTPDSFQWNFATTEDQSRTEAYRLSISDPDIRIVEQDIPEWRNTGEDPDYSVLFDIYEFSEPEKNTP